MALIDELGSWLRDDDHVRVDAITARNGHKEKFMRTRVGLWIDHKKAVLVFLAGKDAEIKRISSNIKKRHRQSGVSMPADDVRQRELAGHLNSYYDEVVSCIRKAESILILGPGEAKGELKKHLEKDNLSSRIVGIKTSDKMTDPQIVALVCGHFLNRPSAASSSLNRSV